MSGAPGGSPRIRRRLSEDIVVGLLKGLDGVEGVLRLAEVRDDLNRGEWESFERAVYACVKDSDATLEWTFTYSSSKDQRPSKATYKAAYESGGCDDASKTFENPCDSASRVAVM